MNYYVLGKIIKGGTDVHDDDDDNDSGFISKKI